MTYCPYCRAPVTSPARFCGSCGKELAAALEPPPEPSPAATTVAEAPSWVVDESPPVPRPGPTGGAGAPPPPRRPTPQWTRLVAVGAGLALIAVIGVVAFRAFTGSGGGAGSPESAVRNLAAAVTSKDASAALTLLAPGEVRSLKDVFTQATGKASKAGILEAGDPFGGIDLNLTDLRLDVQELGDDVAKVTVRSGTLGYTVNEQSAEPPVRSLLAEDRENAGAGSSWGKGTVDLAESRDDGSVLSLMTVRERGRWYVSPAYTALEAWREANGLPPANFALDLSKVSTGSPTPEDAVRDFAAAGQALDSGKLIDLLSPDELGGAARRYRAAIAEGTEEFFEEFDASLRVADSQLVVQNKKGRSAEVAIRSASGTASADGDTARWRIEGNCVNVTTSDGDRTNSCLAEGDPEVGIAALAEAVPNFFVSVTNYRDRWYVSPVQTALRYVELLVDKLTDRQLLAMFEMHQFAKADGSIAAGNPLRGSLKPGEYGVYTFDVGGPGPVQACTNDDDDTNVSSYLYTPDGRAAEELTDGIYLAGTDGSYRVVLRRYDANGSGDFNAVVKPLPVQDVNLPGEASGEVAAGCDRKILRFNASASDHILIQGTLPDSRPAVYDAKGDFVSSGRVFKPRETGTYLLPITGRGSYSLRLERATGNFITQNATVQGSVASRGTAEYQLYASARDRLRISVRGSSGFDGKMDLLSPSGAVLSSADDTNGRDPAITYQFPTDGIYRVRVSGYDGQAGSFSISVT